MEEVKYKIKVFKISNNQVFVHVPSKFYESNDKYSLCNLMYKNINEEVNTDYCCLPRNNSKVLVFREPIEDYINSLLKGCKTLIENNILEVQYSDIRDKIQSAKYIAFNVRNNDIHMYEKGFNSCFMAIGKMGIFTKQNLENKTLKAFNI